MGLLAIMRYQNFVTVLGQGSLGRGLKIIHERLFKQSGGPKASF
jgi:hypothetical protein